MQRVPTFLSAFTRIAAFVIAATAMSQIAVSPAAAQPPQKPKGAKSAGLDIMLMKPTTVKAGDNQFEVMVNGADVRGAGQRDDGREVERHGECETRRERARSEETDAHGEVAAGR